MAIIFGWGGGTPKDQGPVIPITCPNCHNEGFFRYFTARKWFRLYFIPVIPYESRHYLVCPVCTGAMELKGVERSRAARMAQLTASWNAGSLPEDQYLQLVKAFLTDEPLELPTNETPALESAAAHGGAPALPLDADDLAESVVVRQRDHANRALEDNLPARLAEDEEDGVEEGVIVETMSDQPAKVPPLPGSREALPPMPPSTKAVPRHAGYCTSCGSALLLGNARFCHQCGAPVREGSTSSEVSEL